MEKRRTQLNINIDPELFSRLKKKARLSGKTLSAFVSDSLFEQLANGFPETLEDRVGTIEEKLNYFELALSSIAPIKKTTPFTDLEASNCNDFIKIELNR